MAHFLRDQHISNISITEENLIQLSALFSERCEALNTFLTDEEMTDQRAFLTYIIRFDNKGYRVFSVDDLLKYFRLAKSVERILITVETAESLRSSRAIGTSLELRLDEKDPNTSFLTATSDDKDWVDASFSAVQETLAKYKNRNRWVRTAWGARATGGIVALMGAFAGAVGLVLTAPVGLCTSSSGAIDFGFKVGCAPVRLKGVPAPVIAALTCF